MIAIDCSLVLISRNSGANGKARRDADAAHQCDEIGMEIGAVAGVRIARIHGITASPTTARFVVAHSTDYVMIERFRAFEIVAVSRGRFLSQGPERFVDWHQFFWTQVTRSFRIGCRISRFLLADYAVSNFDGFVAI